MDRDAASALLGLVMLIVMMAAWWWILRSIRRSRRARREIDALVRQHLTFEERRKFDKQVGPSAKNVEHQLVLVKRFVKDLEEKKARTIRQLPQGGTSTVVDVTQPREMARSEATIETVEARLARLDDLKERDIITDAEHRNRRQGIIDAL